MKKLLIICLTVVLIMCATVPVFAAGEPSASTVVDDTPGFIVYWCPTCHRLVLTPFKNAHEAIHHTHTTTTQTDIGTGNGKLSTDVDYVAQMTDPNNPTGPKIDSYEWWEVTVPSCIKPGDSKDIVVKGVWSPEKKLTVTADDSVTIKWGTLSKSLDVTLETTSIAGSVENEINETRSVSVEAATMVLGTWKGSFNYTVKFN